MTGSMEQAIKDETIVQKTGRAWAEWLKLLDDWGARDREHKANARYLQDEHELSPWWAQTLTVRYEQERGIRQVGERADGFEVSVSRTIRTDPESAFAAVTDPEKWTRWFTSKAEADVHVGGRYKTADGDVGEFLALDPPRRMRMTWDHPEHAPGTVVEFSVIPKDNERTLLVVTHSKLPNAEAREDLRGGWRGAMDALRTYLES